MKASWVGSILLKIVGSCLFIYFIDFSYFVSGRNTSGVSTIYFNLFGYWYVPLSSKGFLTGGGGLLNGAGGTFVLIFYSIIGTKFVW